MKMTYLAYALLSVALLAWTGVIYAGLSVESAAADRAQAVSQAQQQSDKLAYAARLHSLATETADQRAQLDKLTNSDIVSTVSLIESTGKSVTAKVSDALPEGSGTDLPGGGKIQAITFIVSGQGSFSAVMHALELYEHLPLPSQVTQVEFEHSAANDTKSPPWRLSLRIRVLTSAVISS